MPPTRRGFCEDVHSSWWLWVTWSSLVWCGKVGCNPLSTFVPLWVQSKASKFPKISSVWPLQADVVQQLGRLSFVPPLEHYVHVFKLSLHSLLTDNNLLSLQTLVRSGDTDTSLQSLGLSCCPVQWGWHKFTLFKVCLPQVSYLHTWTLIQ